MIAYSQKSRKRTTIQVATILKAKSGGVREKLALDWWIEKNTFTDVVALVDLSRNKVWMFTKYELIKSAQKKSVERYHIFMYVDPSALPKKESVDVMEYEFENYLINVNCFSGQRQL